MDLYFLLVLTLSMFCLGRGCDNSNQTIRQAQSMSSGSLIFALNIYKQVASSGPNVFLSPFSIRTALGMVEVGAGGNTATQMKSTLQLGNQAQNQINQAYLSVLNSICSSTNYTLNSANRIYVQNKFPVKQSFKTTLEQYYLATATNANFQTNAAAVVQEINQWVANQTDNKINNLFAANDLDSSTVLVLVNAIYFKGTWQTQFDPNLTKNRTFIVGNNQQVSVPMMNVKSVFYYFNDPVELNSQILQMNYAGGDLAMFVFLPSSLNSDSLTVLQSKLTPETFNSARQRVFSQTVNVTIPKFSLDFRRYLIGDLEKLGMTDLFSSAANLSGISDAGGLYVSVVVHQAVVSVDEKGTTAAAATGVGTSKSLPLNPPEIPVFYANHPFVFVIFHLRINQILFIGNVNNPLTTQ